MSPEAGKLSIITLTKDNIEKEHICCAISDKKSRRGYDAKKRWLKQQFGNGYQFKKMDVRGKAFIEYVPIEESWLPLSGRNFMLINCYWVAGQFKGHGNGKKLLDECFTNSKNKDGVIVITGDKKRPFMSDPKFFKNQGFELVDTAKPFFQLWCRKNNQNAPDPSFKKSAKNGECQNKSGIVAYYSDSCPFNEYYINVELRTYAEKKNIPLEIIKVTSKKQAQELPIPWVNCSIFYNGKLITVKMKAEKELDKAIGT